MKSELIIQAIREGKQWEFLTLDGKWAAPVNQNALLPYLERNIEVRVKPEHEVPIVTEEEDPFY